MARIGVKFVKGGKVFALETDNEISIDECVVVESERGLEFAYVTALPKNNSNEENVVFVRVATEYDKRKMEHLNKNIPNVTEITNKLIKKYKLEMKLVDVSYTLDGSKVIISYICEDRVDFRELVKDLAFELKLRIELKQIGVRDQAKTLGGIGLCGKECCCKEYLNDFDKVSVKMAKVQGLSLNPTKISGLCGRLMCCLAYENETYMKLSENMPKLNSRVKTQDGEGVVVYNNLLKQMVSVKIDNNGDIKVIEYELKDITPIAKDKVVENKPQEKKEKVVKEQPKNDDVVEPIVKENKQNNNNENSKKNFKHKKKFNNFKKNKDVKK